MLRVTNRFCFWKNIIFCSPIFLKVYGSNDSDKGPRIPYIKRQGPIHALLKEKTETSKSNYDNIMRAKTFEVGRKQITW